MKSDLVTPGQREGAKIFFGEHSSRFGWTDGFGTTAYIDPENGMMGILFT